MSLAALGGGQNLVVAGVVVVVLVVGGVFCIPALVSGKVTREIDLWPEC
jgi:hypothetical protein